MRSKVTCALFSALVGLLFKAGSSVATEISCPNSIRETPSVSAADKHWIVVASSGERQLDQAEIYLGKPSEYGAQVPDSTTKKQGREIVSWHLVRSPTDTFWLGCSYVGTTAMLFQRLDSTVTFCAVSYELLPSGKRLRLSHVDCR
jgi:hypothetical protein